MKVTERLFLLIVVLALILPGCSLTREPIRYREIFFRPIVALPARNHSASSSIEITQLKNQLEFTTKTVNNVRDSLASLQKFIGSMLVSKNSHVYEAGELESKEFPLTANQTESDHTGVGLRTENKNLSQKLIEINTPLLASSVNTELSVSTPAKTSSSLINEYSKGLLLFKQRQYSKALKIFSNVIEKGIEDNVVDNCEYWIGECYFARREYADAISHFQKVLSIESSNKKADAYFMLGKTYERIGSVKKARTTYIELNTQYLNNRHTRKVNARINAIERKLQAQRNGK